MHDKGEGLLQEEGQPLFFEGSSSSSGFMVDNNETLGCDFVGAMLATGSSSMALFLRRCMSFQHQLKTARATGGKVMNA